MNKFKIILAVLLGTLLSTAAFAQMGVPPATYVITPHPSAGPGGEPTVFDATKNGTTQIGQPETISNVLAAIRADAVDNIGNPISANIQFGDGQILNISSATAEFPISGSTNILSGRIISRGNPTIKVPDGAIVSSEADISNTASGGYAIHNSGSLFITGGTLENTAGGNAIYHDNATQQLILGSSPTIGGIFVASGNLRVFTDSTTGLFAPGQKTYSITFDGELSAGKVVVAAGKNHLGNFTLTNSGWGLAVSGNDLVAIVAPSSSSVTPSSSSAGEVSSSSSETTPIAHYPTPAVNSEVPAYYNIKGEPMGSAKPVITGVYLVKQGNSIRKIVVR